MRKKKHIIIGSGTAALSALKQMRKVNGEDEVKVVTMESHPPYSPTSLPHVISGKISESDIPMVADDFFTEMKAFWDRGKRVEGVDVERSEVVYDSGRTDGYDCLLIATGSEPFVPDVAGMKDKRAQVLQLRTLDDARTLMARMKDSRRAVVLGGGLIGMHVAECLAERGIKVSVVEMLPRILPAYFDRDASMMIRRVLEKQGVTFYTDQHAMDVVWRDGDAVAVSLSEGGVVEADLLVAATGVRPRVSFLNGTGFNANAGIPVDDGMRTRVPNIFAAGDVAAAKAFFDGVQGTNPVLPNAAEQGKIAGAAMAGQGMEYEGWLPMNSFRFFDHLAVSVGKVAASQGDEVLIEKDEDGGTYRKIICRGERLLGVTFIDTPVHAGVFRYLIRRKVKVGRHKDLLMEKPRETAICLMNEAERKETISLEE